MVMRTMRKQFKYLKYFIFLILAAFIGGFAFSCGVGKSRNPNAPATVNGETISDQHFSRALQSRLDQLRDEFGGEIPASETRKARREVLDALEDQALIQQNAKKIGISVSNDELAQTIKSIPRFRGKDGQFNSQAYIQFLSQQAQEGISQDEVEESLREEILNSNVRQQWLTLAQVSPLEVQQGLEKIHRQVKAKALVWAYKPLQDKVELTEDQLKDYYSQHRQEWAKPEEVKARHILVKVDPQGGPDADAKAKAKADELYKQLKAGANFAELAKKSSDDPGSAKRGGDLGFFGRGMMVPEFEKKAFELKPGEISEPVKSQFGYHIIKVEEKKKAFEPTFENSRDKAKDELTLQKAKQQASQMANLADLYLKEGQSLDSVAKGLTMSVQSTGWFSRNDEKVIPSLGKEPSLARNLLNLDLEQPSDPLFLEKGIVIAVLTEQKPGSPAKKADEDKEKAEVLNRLRNMKAQALFDGWLKSLRAQAKIEENLALFGD